MQPVTPYNRVTTDPDPYKKKKILLLGLLRYLSNIQTDKQIQRFPLSHLASSTPTEDPVILKVNNPSKFAPLHSISPPHVYKGLEITPPILKDIL